jgi:hypothetical protein
MADAAEPMVFLSRSAAWQAPVAPVRPFAGKDLAQLQATSTFLLAALGSAASLAGLVFILRDWHPRTFLKTLLLLCFGVMAVFTFRAAYRAAYINYDNAKEYLVYAHSTRDMKDVLEQVETISKRLYGDKSIAVAYDNDSLYPFWGTCATIRIKSGSAITSPRICAIRR